MDIPSAFYWFSLKAAPHDSMHWMSADEIKRYKLTTSLVAALGEPDDEECRNRAW